MSDVSTDDAIAICKSWFAHNEKVRAQSIAVQRLATMARKGEVDAARRGLANIDRAPIVFDGSRLEPAVRKLMAEIDRLRAEVERLKAAMSRCLLGDPPGDCYAAEVVTLRAEAITQVGELQTLLEERDNLRTDAERYRFLRSLPFYRAEILDQALDAHRDAARSAGGE